MEFKGTIFAIIAVSMVIIAASVAVDQLGDAYNSGITSDLGKFNKLDSATDEVGDMQGRMVQQSGEASSDYEQETFRSGYGILTNIFKPLRLVFGEDGMIDSVIERFGLPDYIWNGWIAMISIAITTTIIAIVFRRAYNKV